MSDRELIETYFRCLNTDDWTTMATLWAEDGVYEPEGGRRREGADEILAFYPKMFGPWTVHVDDPVTIEVLEPGLRAHADVRFTGTSGGRDYDFMAEDDFELRDGRFTLIRTRYDVEALRRQMAENVG